MRLSQYLDFYWDRFADFKDLRVVMAWESKYAILPYTVNPSVKEVTMSKKKECPECGGTGLIESYDGQMTCVHCEGKGKVYKEGCPVCGAKNFSTALMDYGAYKQMCNECGW